MFLNDAAGTESISLDVADWLLAFLGIAVRDGASEDSLDGLAATFLGDKGVCRDFSGESGLGAGTFSTDWVGKFLRVDSLPLSFMGESGDGCGVVISDEARADGLWKALEGDVGDWIGVLTFGLVV